MNNQKLAFILDEAALQAKAVAQLSQQVKFDVDQAYSIQTDSINRRYERGETFIGVKMGFTSKAKMEQMGVHDMIWGRLTNSMLLQVGEDMPMNKFIHPRAEPELCFRVKKRVDQLLNAENVGDYIDGVAAAIEIIDSRFQNFKFCLEDVIADNCSSAGLVFGDWHPIDTDISDLKIELEIAGEVVQTGTSNAILGNPWESVFAAARLCQQYKQELPEGALIMAGAATSAVYLKPNQTVKAHIQDLGSVHFQTV